MESQQIDVISKIPNRQRPVDAKRSGDWGGNREEQKISATDLLIFGDFMNDDNANHFNVYMSSYLHTYMCY